MSVSKSAWERYAPPAFLFIVGITLGFVLGFGSGIIGGSGAIYILILPIAALLIAFVLFSLVARGIGKRESS